MKARLSLWCGRCWMVATFAVMALGYYFAVRREARGGKTIWSHILGLIVFTVTGGYWFLKQDEINDEVIDE